MVSPTTGEVLDDALVLWMPGPASATGEDVVEFHVHGSRAVVGAVLDAVTTLEDVRLAEAGEFTRRAIETGVMDLTEVEGLGDLLHADTEQQRRQALRQLGGQVRQQYDEWREVIVGCLAHVEAFIDFGEDEEDVDEAVYAAVADRLQGLLASLRRHLSDGGRGEIVRDGLRVAIVGPPNAGKSSLLNALARRPAAIVSDVPGTTRDIVDVSLNVGGFAVHMSDTAGVRETEDAVEREGVTRARAAADDAHLRVCVFDAQTFPDDVDPRALNMITPEALVVLNKVDLVPDDAMRSSAVAGIPVPSDAIRIWHTSCTTGTGIDDFVSGLTARVADRLAAGEEDGVLITRARHRQHLQDTADCVQRFLDKPAQVDLAAEELRVAVRALGRITGRVDVEDLLDVIFRDFCIGK